MATPAFTGLISLYQTLVEALAGTGYVKWCDIDFGQGMNKEKDYEIEYPAALFKFDEVIWQGTTDDGSIRGVVTLSIKVICQILTEEDWLVPMQVRSEVVAYYELLAQIHSVVIALHSDNFSPLILFNQFHINTPIKEMLWTEILQYRCNIQTNGGLDNPDGLIISVDSVQDDNSFMERKEYNLMSR